MLLSLLRGETHSEVEVIDAVTKQVADGVEVLEDVRVSDPDIFARARLSLRKCLNAIAAAAPFQYSVSGEDVRLLISSSAVSPPPVLYYRPK